MDCREIENSGTRDSLILSSPALAHKLEQFHFLLRLSRLLIGARLGSFDNWWYSYSWRHAGRWLWPSLVVAICLRVGSRFHSVVDEKQHRENNLILNIRQWRHKEQDCSGGCSLLPFFCSFLRQLLQMRNCLRDSTIGLVHMPLLSWKQRLMLSSKPIGD